MVGSTKSSLDPAQIASVNLWTLERDASIKALLINLIMRLGESSFIIDAVTPSHFQSVFIAHPALPEVRAYLYCYGQAPNCYGVHLEHPQESVEANLFDVYENIKLDRLVEMLAVHFEVA